MNHGYEFDAALSEEHKAEQERKQKEREARKRLEAVAPDLLDALKKIKRIENGCKSRGVGYDMQVDILATDAIAKAEQE